MHLRRDCCGDVGCDLRDHVDKAAAVAPLVVVPAEYLGHAPVRHRQLAVDDARVLGVDDVRRDERVVRIAKDALERTSFGRGPIGVIDLVDGHVAAEPDNEVRDRSGGHRSANGDAVDLPLEVGHYEPDRTGGTGRSRDEVDRGRAGPAQILVR